MKAGLPIISFVIVILLLIATFRPRTTTGHDSSGDDFDLLDYL